MSRDKHTTSASPLVKISDQFSRWTVISPFDRVGGKPRWLCRCQCGVEKPVYERYLLVGSSTSCGCFRRELVTAKNTTHGHNVRGKRTAEYNVWVNIRHRCYSPKDKHWDIYGGRGITVCARWRESFEAFIEDMGPKPSRRHQIDRRDNDLGYWCGKAECPECSPECRLANCRWATPIENASNKSNNVFLEHDGKRLTQNEWSRITGLSPATLCERRAAGLSDSEVLTIPAQPGRKLT